MSGIGNSGLTGRTIKIRQGVPTAYNPRLLHAPPALTYLLLGKISKYQTKLSPDGNGCQTPQLHYRGEEAQIKHFCAVGQHHERQQGGGGGWQKPPGCKEQPALLLFSLSACCVDEMHKQHPEQFLPGSGTVVQDCRDVVYAAGRAAKSFFGVGTVCVVPALPSAGKVQCVGRARRNRYNPAQTRAHPNEGGGADGHSALQILLY